MSPEPTPTGTAGPAMKVQVGRTPHDQPAPLRLHGHLAMVGRTGSGKTTLASAVITQLASCGAQVMVMDPKKDAYMRCADTFGLDGEAGGRWSA